MAGLRADQERAVFMDGTIPVTSVAVHVGREID
jgi:hypothetical protein